MSNLINIKHCNVCSNFEDVVTSVKLCSKQGYYKLPALNNFSWGLWWSVCKYISLYFSKKTPYVLTLMIRIPHNDDQCDSETVFILLHFPYPMTSFTFHSITFNWILLIHDGILRSSGRFCITRYHGHRVYKHDVGESKRFNRENLTRTNYFEVNIG